MMFQGTQWRPFFADGCTFAVQRFPSREGEPSWGLADDQGKLLLELVAQAPLLYAGVTQRDQFMSLVPRAWLMLPRRDLYPQFRALLRIGMLTMESVRDLVEFKPGDIR